MRAHNWLCLTYMYVAHWYKHIYMYIISVCLIYMYMGMSAGRMVDICRSTICFASGCQEGSSPAGMRRNAFFKSIFPISAPGPRRLMILIACSSVEKIGRDQCSR